LIVRLLAEGPKTEGELSAILSVPPAKIRSTIAPFLQEGLVAEREGRLELTEEGRRKFG